MLKISFLKKLTKKGAVSKQHPWISKLVFKSPKNTVKTPFTTDRAYHDF